MPEEQLNQTQAFQQALSTAITCRTLIKYNSNLSTEQKQEILDEIDTTLAFLNRRLETSGENNTIPAPGKTSPAPGPELAVEHVERTTNQNEPASDEPAENKEIPLQQLQRLYRVYLSSEPDKGIAALETRYKTVMGVLDQLETLAELRHDATASDQTIDALLSRIRGFITAVYCMFREFATLLTKIVEGQSMDVDTEAMALLDHYPPEHTQQLIRDITPLARVYEKQCQRQRRKGSLHENAREAIAFLIFLQDSLQQTFARRQDIVVQLKSTTGLLNEAIALLADYELAVTTLMQSPSAWQ